MSRKLTETEVAPRSVSEWWRPVVVGKRTAHVDGLVYNYGNSLSANFTGDAKNVIKIANIIYF